MLGLINLSRLRKGKYVLSEKLNLSKAEGVNDNLISLGDRAPQKIVKIV